MGIPAFFRWLSRKYPSIIVYSTEEKASEVDGKRKPVDSSQPNPNGIEFDNLYLDMNGIIHPCTHPEDAPPPKNEDEMMIAIFNCIDRLFNIVRPRKLLYMAIDGVAPRAKMNQQRSRRFRASKETAEKLTEIKRIRAELLLKGCVLPPEKPKEEHFDSNCITPGTPFMARLSECLNYYIHDRLNSDPGWKGIKVVLSDANVPGEGEHKIMDYIRKQRAQPDHDPNTQHVLCGADADLIMLGLATHEPNFTIIREEFKPNQAKPCDICGRLGHTMSDCLGIPQTELNQDPDIPLSSETTYIFIRLSVLREYLQRELVMPNFVKFEFERLLDDWVFMCFFVGNDFLPHLPSLEIRENAIDRLITLYKDCLHKTGGYLTDSGEVNLERVQLILLELGKVEDEIFRTRKQKDIMFKQRDKMRRRSEGFNANRPNLAALKNTQFAPKAINEVATVSNARQEAYSIRKAAMQNTEQSSDHQAGLNSMLRNDDASGSTSGVKRKRSEDEDSDDEPNDEVRLWEDGFKDRYYESKFDVECNDLEFRYSVAFHYIRGLCWVLKYYYQGCASWKWYYPYHYAPFASDFINIANSTTQFETDTKPFNPLEQLMGVFPAASGNHVPEPWAKLMTDPESSIIDFYPEDFKIDLNGKKYAWQGVALLPFVDEDRLFETLKPHYSELTPAEQKRNKIGDDRLYVSNKNESYGFLKGLYQQNVEDMESAILIEGVKGTVLLSEFRVPENNVLTSPVNGLPDVYDNLVECVKFRNPTYGKGFVFRATRLKGAKDPPKVLKPTDFPSHGNWRSQIGMAPATQRANLDMSAHRALNHFTRNNRGQQHHHQQQQGYSNSTPPPSIVGFRNYHDSGNHGLQNISQSLLSYVPHRYNTNSNRNQRSNQSYGQYQQQQRNSSYQGSPHQHFHNSNNNNNNNTRYRPYDPRNNPRNNSNNSNNSNRYSYRR